MAYICPNCKKEYKEPIKLCECETASFSEHDEYILNGPEITMLKKEEYSSLLKFARKKPKESEFWLVHRNSNWGVETASFEDEQTYLTKEEFLKCRRSLDKIRAEKS